MPDDRDTHVWIMRRIPVNRTVGTVGSVMSSSPLCAARVRVRCGMPAVCEVDEPSIMVVVYYPSVSVRRSGRNLNGAWVSKSLLLYRSAHRESSEGAASAIMQGCMRTRHMGCER